MNIWYNHPRGSRKNDDVPLHDEAPKCHNVLKSNELEDTLLRATNGKRLCLASGQM